MKDQNAIIDDETKKEKWNRGLDIFIESVIKPDPSLRQCAHNQRCYHELMDVRQNVLDYLENSEVELMDLPINDKELETIISALRFGGDFIKNYQKLWTYKMNYKNCP